MSVDCIICGQPGAPRRIRLHPDEARGGSCSEVSNLCDVCRKLVDKKPSPSLRGRKRDRHVPAPTTRMWIDALRRSWGMSGDCFRCELSGLRLDTIDPHSPLAVSCDHDPPGSNNYLVVAWLLNDMKNDHTRVEFYRNVRALAEIIAHGAPDIAAAERHHDSFSGISHWRRK